jgi:hypothetical protein
MKMSRLFLPFALVVAALLALSTLQTIPNGSQHYYMIDVGETQTVLNLWGTLHATGYPLYVMTGSALVGLLRALGIAPETAPALVSLFWHLIALGLFYAFLRRIGIRGWIAAGTLIAFAAARTVWIHGTIAEIYSLTLALLALMLWIAVSKQPGRALWLALIGGFAVAHHRALAFAAFGLIFMVWDDLFGERRRIPLKIAACIGLALIGFLPYLYLPLRAWAGARWVYGDPGTLSGFLDQFLGREADRFFGVDGFDGLIANLGVVTQVLLTDAGMIGLIAGVIGLIMGAVRRETRRAALMLILIGGLAYGFHVAAYTDVLSALILMALLPLAVGWAFAAERVLRLVPAWGQIGVGVGLAAYAASLFVWHQPFIRDLTADQTGLRAIDAARRIPTGAVAMIPWGVHHAAIGFARDVTGEIGGFDLVDHNADLRALKTAGREIVTLSDTFYNFPASWWSDRLGAPVYLHTAAPGWVEVAAEPWLAMPIDGAFQTEVVPITPRLVCDAELIAVDVLWYAHVQPTRDLSVFVHLIDSSGAVIAQADQRAPVYGWRPLTTWVQHEYVRDIYPLPRMPGSAVNFGLYAVLPDGGFENVLSETLPLDCP